MTTEEKRKRDEEIIKLSEKLSQKEIGLIYNLSQTAISLILRKNNIKRSKTRLNLSKLRLNLGYFEKIDTPKKAYWLGFITADGNIKKTGDKVTLCVADKEIVEKFKKDIESEHKISEEYVFDKRTKKAYHRFMIQVTSYNFTQNIIKHGITENKSDICFFPKMTSDLYPYFIAGLFDGDGSVVSYKNKIKCSLISTKEILDFIDNLLLKELDINPLKRSKVTKNKNNVYKAFWYKDSIKFLDYIYQGQKEIYLARKYDIYKEYNESHK